MLAKLYHLRNFTTLFCLWL